MFQRNGGINTVYFHLQDFIFWGLLETQVIAIEKNEWYSQTPSCFKLSIAMANKEIQLETQLYLIKKIQNIPFSIMMNVKDHLLPGYTLLLTVASNGTNLSQQSVELMLWAQNRSGNLLPHLWADRLPQKINVVLKCIANCKYVFQTVPSPWDCHIKHTTIRSHPYTKSIFKNNTIFMLQVACFINKCSDGVVHSTHIIKTSGKAYIT